MFGSGDVQDVRFLSFAPAMTGFPPSMAVMPRRTGMFESAMPGFLYDLFGAGNPG